MPGRKRPTKKQISTDRVNSEISLNGGDTTSESESESLLVSGACSQTATIDSGNPSLHSLALSTAEESNPAPTSDCLQSCLSANEDTHTVIRDNSTRPRTYVSPPRLQRFDITQGSGDDMETNSNQTASIGPVLHSFLSRVESQGETNNKAMRDCMMAQGEANRELMRDCMIGITSLVKENNSQSQSNFQLLLKGLTDLGTKVESLTNASSAQASITESDSRDSQSAVVSLTPTADQTSTSACTENVLKDTTHTCLKQPEIPSDTSRSGTIASTQLNTNTHSSAVSSSTSIGSSADSTKTHNVRLPAFNGKSNEWKVWFSRFTAVANVNKWNDTTRLCELLQRLQGVAAEFVFDEISPDCQSDYSNLVRELDLRFKCVETNKSYRALFSKRTQHFGESVENYASELKRLYDKAYPGKNPDMRKTLLLQQFMGGLGDKRAKCAVEYFKEPSSIEDAVHNVVMYMETHQAQHTGIRSLNKPNYKTVNFAFDDDYEDDDDDTAVDDFYDPSHRERVPPPRSSPSATHARQEHAQSIRKIQGSDAQPNSPENDQLSSELQGLRTVLSKLSQAIEISSSPNLTMKPDTHARSNRPPVAPTSTSNPVQGHGMGQLHGQARTRDRLTNVQCYECHGWGHMKRECPTLLTKQNTGRNSVSTPPLSHRPASLLYPFYDHSTPSSNSIALN